MVAALAAQGCQLAQPHRPPRAVSEADLLAASQVIALDDTEHRPLIASRFPTWIELTTFWDVPDVEHMPATAALPLIEREVDRLLASL